MGVGITNFFLIRRKMLPTSTKGRPVSCGAQVLAKVGAPFSHALENSLIEGKWVAKPVGLGPVLDVPCWVTFRCGRSAPGSRYAPGPFEWNARWGLAGLALRPSGLMPVCVGFSRNLGEARRFGVGRGVKCAQSPKNGPQTVYVVPKIE